MFLNIFFKILETKIFAIQKGKLLIRVQQRARDPEYCNSIFFTQILRYALRLK